MLGTCQAVQASSMSTCQKLMLPSVRVQRAANGEDYQRTLQAFVQELKTMPIAVETDAANEQHYEVVRLTVNLTHCTLSH